MIWTYNVIYKEICYRYISSDELAMQTLFLLFLFYFHFAENLGIQFLYA